MLSLLSSHALPCSAFTPVKQSKTHYRYKSEVSQQKVLFRGSFGTQRPGGAGKNVFDIFVKNAANTSIVLWGGRLLALFEAAQPIAMDPYSLQTLGPDLLGGNVRPGASFHLGKVANKFSGIEYDSLLLAELLDVYIHIDHVVKTMNAADLIAVWLQTAPT